MLMAPFPTLPHHASIHLPRTGGTMPRWVGAPHGDSHPSGDSECCTVFYWLVVSTPLKNISQLGWLFPVPIYGQIKNVPNHLVISCHILSILSYLVISYLFSHESCPNLSPLLAVPYVNKSFRRTSSWARCEIGTISWQPSFSQT